MIKELLLKNRTVRRYTRDAVTADTLADLIDCARLCASAGNLQRLRFGFITGTGADEAFSAVSLGGYLPPEEKPTYNDRPSAYIVIFTEKEPDTNLAIDIGIAAEAITLAAAEKGIGCCMIRNFKREEISAFFEAPLIPELVISLGVGAQEALIVTAGEDIKYYTGDGGKNIVPKRALSELIIK